MANIPQAYVKGFLRHYLVIPGTKKMLRKVFGSSEELLFRNENQKAMKDGYDYVCSQDELEVILSYSDNGELMSTLWKGPYIRKRADQVAAPSFPMQFMRAAIRVSFDSRIWDTAIDHGLSPTHSEYVHVPMSLDEVITRYDPDLDGMTTPEPSKATKKVIEREARAKGIGRTVQRVIGGNISLKEGELC